MKHNCYGRDREMVLEWRCTKCGETVCAEEFDEEDLITIEHLAGDILEKINGMKKPKYINDPRIIEYKKQVESVLEKVRKM